MTTEYRKPLPIPEHAEPTKAFWEAAKRHELVMPRCTHCNDLHWPPREQCPQCFSQDIDWVPVSGKGRVYAFTIVYQAAHPVFQEETPYAFAAIDLDEGTRIISNIMDCPIEDVKVDMPVVAVFDDVTPEWTLVRFRPA